MGYKDKEKQREYQRQWHIRHKESSGDRQRRRRREARELMNSYKQECIRCGYSKCKGALEFHHRDSRTKLGGITEIVHRLWKAERIIAEIAKCDVLCANCHREGHCEKIPA